jgi:hypothetical protein
MSFDRVLTLAGYPGRMTSIRTVQSVRPSRRKLRCQRRGSGLRLRTHGRFGRDEVDERLAGGTTFEGEFSCYVGKVVVRYVW